MKKIVLIFIGWLCVSLAFVGTFVPGIPTTIFLIVALWLLLKVPKSFMLGCLVTKDSVPF